MWIELHAWLELKRTDILYHISFPFLTDSPAACGMKVSSVSADVAVEGSTFCSTLEICSFPGTTGCLKVLESGRHFLFSY